MADEKLQSGQMRSPFLEEFGDTNTDDGFSWEPAPSPFADETPFAHQVDQVPKDVQEEFLPAFRHEFHRTEDPEDTDPSAPDSDDFVETGVDKGADFAADEELDLDDDWSGSEFLEDETEDFSPDPGEDVEDWPDEAVEEEAEDWPDDEAEAHDAVLDDPMEQEFEPGSLKEKVQWYQAILHHALGWRDVPLNGKHNDPTTRARMREFQKSFALKTVNGYLTVEANKALTEVALYWLYSLRSPERPFGGGWGKGIRDAIMQFQRDYGLAADGEVGAQTRGKMVRLLTGRDALILKNYHPYLGSRELMQEEFDEPESPEMLTELESRFDKGIFGEDDRKRVNDTISIPHRWMCHIGTNNFHGGSGVLIGPRHVLTNAHVVSSLYTDGRGRITKPSRFAKITVSPGYNNAPSSRRVYVKAPFGSFEVDLGKSLIPPEYIQAGNGEKDEKGRPYLEGDWDFAVLELKKPVGTMSIRPKKLRGRKGTIDVSPRRIGYWLEENRIDVVAEEGVEKPHSNSKLWTFDELEGQRVFTEGYPADLKGLQATSVVMPSQMLTSLSRAFVHYLDSVSGQSGSPVWRKEEDGVLSLIGILRTVTLSLSGRLFTRKKPERNSAVAITPEVVHRICDHFSDTFVRRWDFDPNRKIGVPPRHRRKIVGLKLRKDAK